MLSILLFFFFWYSLMFYFSLVNAGFLNKRCQCWRHRLHHQAGDLEDRTPLTVRHTAGAAVLTRVRHRRSAVAQPAGRPVWTVRLTLQAMLVAATSTRVPRCRLRGIIRYPLDPPYRRREPVLPCTGKMRTTSSQSLRPVSYFET